MSTAWQSYLNLLPHWLRDTVDKQGRGRLTELRLRVGHPVQMRFVSDCLFLEHIAKPEDIQFIINIATKYSPWISSTVCKGFITGEGGHRIGICGDAVLDSRGNIQTIENPSSLNIRVARDVVGVADKIGHFNDSILIIGRPGCGKTTLLRDYIRQRSDLCFDSVCVVDERREIFPKVRGQCCFYSGKQTDILSGCNKAQGIDMAIRCMNPGTIAVDEITEDSDCKAILYAGWCGVKLLATAHAESKDDLYTRPIYKPIVSANIFQYLVVMSADKRWHLERISV